MDPEEAYLAWTLELETAAGRAAIEEVFSFVADECGLAIVPAEAAATPPAPAPGSPPSAAPPAGEGGPATPRDPVVNGRSIRVDVDKVDRLVNLVGELVINQAMLMQDASGLPAELCGSLLTAWRPWRSTCASCRKA